MRLEDAELLLTGNNGRLAGAFYLAGYTLECYLRACLLQDTALQVRLPPPGDSADHFKWRLIHRTMILLDSWLFYPRRLPTNCASRPTHPETGPTNTNYYAGFAQSGQYSLDTPQRFAHAGACQSLCLKYAV